MRVLQITFTDAVAPRPDLYIGMDESTWRNVSTLHEIERFIGHMAFTRKEVQRSELTLEQDAEARRLGIRLFGWIHD